MNYTLSKEENNALETCVTREMKGMELGRVMRGPCVPARMWLGWCLVTKVYVCIQERKVSPGLFSLLCDRAFSVPTPTPALPHGNRGCLSGSPPYCGVMALPG